MNKLNEPYNYGYWHNAYFGDNWLEQPQYSQHAFFRANSEGYDSGDDTGQLWDDERGSDTSQDGENEIRQGGYRRDGYWRNRGHAAGLIDEEDHGAGNLGESWPDDSASADVGHFGDDQYYDEYGNGDCVEDWPYGKAWYGEAGEEAGGYEQGSYREVHCQYMVWGEDYEDDQTYGDYYDGYDIQVMEYGQCQECQLDVSCGNREGEREEDEENVEDVEDEEEAEEDSGEKSQEEPKEGDLDSDHGRHEDEDGGGSDVKMNKSS